MLRERCGPGLFVRSVKRGDKLARMVDRFRSAQRVEDMKEKVFPAKPVHFLSANKDGKQVRVV